MASLAFNDGVARTLTNPLASPANRFKSWRPASRPIGPSRVVLGTGIPYVYVHRTDYTASFEVRHLKPSDLDAALRFQVHAEAGGVFTVTTSDTGARVYTCYLAPGTKVEITGPDEAYEYTVALTVLNSAAAHMLCTY